jgi:arylsulfatase A-like enzyme
VRSGRAPEPAQGIDLFPTVAALLGFSPPPGLPGQNVLAAHEARPVVSETHAGIGRDGSGSPLLSLRAHGWKLIHAPATGRFELYDLAHDPGEHEDRFAEAPEGAGLVEELAAWRAAQPAAPPVAGGSPEVRERLRALGYVDH